MPPDWNTQRVVPSRHHWMQELPRNLVRNADPEPGGLEWGQGIRISNRSPGGDADAAGPWSPQSDQAGCRVCVLWGGVGGEK